MPKKSEKASLEADLKLHKYHFLILLGQDGSQTETGTSKAETYDKSQFQRATFMAGVVLLGIGYQAAKTLLTAMNKDRKTLSFAYR